MTLPSTIAAGAMTLERLNAAWAEPFAVAFRASEPEVRAWMPSAADEQQDAVLFVEVCDRAFADGTAFPYAMVERGEVVGYINLTPSPPPLPGTPPGDEGAEAGYWVRTDRAGAGRASAALVAITNAAFARLPGLTHVAVECDAANTASRRTAEKAGFVLASSRNRAPRTASETDTVLIFHCREYHPPAWGSP